MSKIFNDIPYKPNINQIEDYLAVQSLVDDPNKLVAMDARFADTSKQLRFFNYDIRHFKVLDYDLKPKYAVYYSKVDNKLRIEKI